MLADGDSKGKDKGKWVGEVQGKEAWVSDKRNGKGKRKCQGMRTSASLRV